MPKILFLDDDELRIKTFRSHYPSADIARTASGCIERLERILDAGEELDELYLDHDLDGGPGVDAAVVGTGMDVVRWMAVHSVPVNRLIVHSLNRNRAREMGFALKKAGYRRINMYSWLKIKADLEGPSWPH